MKTENNVKGIEAISDPELRRLLNYVNDGMFAKGATVVEVKGYRTISVLVEKIDIDSDFIRAFRRFGFNIDRIMAHSDYTVEVEFQREL